MEHTVEDVDELGKESIVHDSPIHNVGLVTPMIKLDNKYDTG